MHKTILAALLAIGLTPHAATAQTTQTMAAPPQNPIRDGKVEANGVQYHYLIAKGRGVPIVLLHGWGDLLYVALCDAGARRARYRQDRGGRVQ